MSIATYYWNDGTVSTHNFSGSHTVLSFKDPLADWFSLEREVIYDDNDQIIWIPSREDYPEDNYTPGQVIRCNGDLTFYEHVTNEETPEEYTVTYQGNGAESGVPSSCTGSTGYFDPGSYCVGSAPSRAGYVFAGWRSVVTGNIFYPGDDFPVGKEFSNNKATLVALWDPLYVISIFYDGNLATENIPESQTFSGAKGSYGDYFVSGTIPALEGHIFKGWRHAGTGEVLSPGSYIPLDFSSNQTITLIAWWESESTNVRVKTSSGWKVGKKLFKKTESGWKPAKRVGIRTENGWK